jgi:hypothetical protein
MCDRGRQSRVALQRGFVDAVAAPLFRAAARLLPGLAPAVRQLEENRRAMDALDDAALLRQAQPAAPPPAPAHFACLLRQRSSGGSPAPLPLSLVPCSPPRG